MNKDKNKHLGNVFTNIAVAVKKIEFTDRPIELTIELHNRIYRQTITVVRGSYILCSAEFAG